MSVSPAIYETLAKSIAYNYSKPEFLEQASAFLEENGYLIDQTFEDPETGLHGLGLISTTADKPPVLVFRGPEFVGDDRAFSNDGGIGFQQFEANREQIGNWLQKISADSTKNPKRLLPDVIGHGLGGALSQYTAAEFTPFIGDVVTFNSPGVPARVVATFKRNQKVAKNISHYIVNGDLVSLFGETYLPGKVFIQTFTDNTINPLAVLNKTRTENLLSDPPTGLLQRQISVEQLSSSDFSYTNDPDFKKFQAALSVPLPDLLTALRTRSSAESLRLSGSFSFADFLKTIQIDLAPSQPNYLVGDEQNNLAKGAGGNDTLIGNGGQDVLYGNQGEDILSGGAGNDLLFGGRGDDILIGGEGNDTLSGDGGSDILTGGPGRDVFVVTPRSGLDKFSDFTNAEDLIGLGGGLTYTQIRVVPTVDGSQIVESRTGEVLAFIPGVAFTDLSQADFVKI